MRHLNSGIKSLSVLFALAFVIIFGAVAPTIAQDKPADDGGLVQVELTEDQVKGYLKVGPKLAEMFERIDKAGGEPDKKLTADLEALAKEGGYKSFEEMETIVSNITFIMSGMNDEDGTFTEPVEVLKKELEDTKADKELKGDEKKQMIESIQESIAQTPKLKYPGNVELVKKHLKELSSLFQ
jgi:hypothetical protein